MSSLAVVPRDEELSSNAKMGDKSYLILLSVLNLYQFGRGLFCFLALAHFFLILNVFIDPWVRKRYHLN
jgi:hypothetical protein